MKKLGPGFPFPWRIFTRIVLIQSAFVLIALAASGMAARYFFKKQLRLISEGSVPLDQISESLRVFDQSFVLFLVFIAAVLALFAVWAGRALVFPIGRLLVKAKSALTGELPSEVSANYTAEELGRESFGEFSDLEASLEDIRKDLADKRARIRKERQELATLMSSISDAVLAVDQDESLLFYNSRFAVIFGKHVDLGKKELRLWQFFRDPEILHGFSTALKEGKTSLVRSFPVELSEGRRHLSLSVSPLRREDQTIYGAVGIFHDVTELKASEQIRIDFVANVSHELRTPLTAIKGFTDTLLQDAQAGKPMSPEFLAPIARNTDRLMSLINDLLDLSSLESSAEMLQRSWLDTREITEKVIDQMRSVFEKRSQKVETSFEARQVFADPRRIEQVLVNLVDNASKYSPVSSTLHLSWSSGKDRSTLLMVSDTGPGIPAEHHPRLFERFFRVDRARSRDMGGTGLGLSIVKHVMQRHEGSVWVESKPGQGSTFICQFPGSTQH